MVALQQEFLWPYLTTNLWNEFLVCHLKCDAAFQLPTIHPHTWRVWPTQKKEKNKTMKIKSCHSFTASVACKFRKISMGKCDWKTYSNLVDVNKNPLMESFPHPFLLLQAINFLYIMFYRHVCSGNLYVSFRYSWKTCPSFLKKQYQLYSIENLSGQPDWKSWLLYWAACTVGM
jgi:hypothetical protein